MKTVKERLNPYRDRVIQCARERGRDEALRLAQKLAGVKDPPTFTRWLEDTTNDKTIGLHPTKLEGLADNPWITRERLVQAFTRQVANAELIASLTAENEELNREIKELMARLLKLKSGKSREPPMLQLAEI